MAIITTLFLVSPLYSQGSNWITFDSKVLPKASDFGAKFTSKIPPGFAGESENDALFSGYSYYLENLIGDTVNSVTYLAIQVAVSSEVIPEPQSFLKTSDGKWNKTLVDLFFEGFAMQQEGLTSNIVSYINDLPTLDLTYQHLSTADGYPIYFDSDVRVTLTDRTLIKYECGEMQRERGPSKQPDNVNAICKPFFNSLKFY
jgi:hypothetical protein